MISEWFENIISRDSETASKAVHQFPKIASEQFCFGDLNTFEKRQNVWSRIYELASTSQDSEIVKDSFSSIRILSREKVSLDTLVTDKWLCFILNYTHSTDLDEILKSKETQEIIVEGLKALCNIVFNCPSKAEKCFKMDILNKIEERMDAYSNEDFPNAIKFFDMKTYFLISALCPEVQKERNNYTSRSKMIRILQEFRTYPNHTESNDNNVIFLNSQQCSLVCQILTALFNLCLQSKEDATELTQFHDMVIELRQFLIGTTESIEQTTLLHTNIVNLLSALPCEIFHHLKIGIEPTENVLELKNLYENFNMQAVYNIVQLLNRKLCEQPAVTKQHELISPIVSVLLKAASSDREIRKYLRLNILPPLRDVRARPEQGTTIRNYLCQLLTTPQTELKDLVAEFLFVLCKENVARLIKYTGYGNAAGMLAQRGLLATGSHSGQSKYSSDSEDSETEEYSQQKDGINPVTGCYEPLHINSMENMTQEQKEYEAVKLINLMDKLIQNDRIRPCTIGPDGKPQPIQHVLQLQEKIEEDVKNGKKSDSDTE